MDRSELRGGGAKSITVLAPVSFFRYWGARSLEAGAKYGHDALAGSGRRRR
jgi:hypothetical protein